MYVEVMSPLMGEAVKHDRVSDSSKPGQWVYGSSASNISETCVAEPRDFNHWEYQGTCLRYPPFPLVSGVLYVSTLGRAADVPSVWFESIFCMVRRVAGDRSKDDGL